MSLADDGDTAAVQVVVTSTFELTPLFDDNGELRLWDGSEGWSGFVREVSDGTPRFYWVNKIHDGQTIDRERVGPKAVREAIAEHVRDPEAAGRGNWKRGCSPP